MRRLRRTSRGTRGMPREAPAVPASPATCRATVISLRSRMPDHTISVPAPENTVRYGIPNACTECHQDKDCELGGQDARPVVSERPPAAADRARGCVQCRPPPRRRGRRPADRDRIRSAAAAHRPRERGRIPAVLPDPSGAGRPGHRGRQRARRDSRDGGHRTRGTRIRRRGGDGPPQGTGRPAARRPRGSGAVAAQSARRGAGGGSCAVRVCQTRLPRPRFPAHRRRGRDARRRQVPPDESGRESSGRGVGKQPAARSDSSRREVLPRDRKTWRRAALPTPAIC